MSNLLEQTIEALNDTSLNAKQVGIVFSTRYKLVISEDNTFWAGPLELKEEEEPEFMRFIYYGKDATKNAIAAYNRHYKLNGEL